MRLAGIRGYLNLKLLVLFLATAGGTVILFQTPSTYHSPLPTSDCLVEGAYPADVEGNTDPPKKVILVSIDTLRADRLNSYADYRDYARHRNTSPNIESFADESIVFENALTQASSTLPAHVSLFTSTYPSTHRIRHTSQVISEEYLMTAEVFSEHGYATAGFHGSGKLSEDYRFDQGFDVYTERHGEEPPSSFQSSFPGALSWLSDHRNESFFLFVHGYDAHGPYKDPPPYQNYFADSHAGPMETALDNRFPNNKTLRVSSVNGSPVLLQDHEPVAELSGEDIDDARDAYDSGVRFTDTLFGEFIEGLKRQGVYNDSIIVLLGDHGETLGERGHLKHHENPMFGHWYLWESVAHVPLMMRIPGVGPRRVRQPVSLLDVSPTLYDHQDISVGSSEEKMRGRSLLGLITTDASDLDRFAIMESTDLEDTLIRGSRWALLARESGEDELYRLDGGPAERVTIDGNRRTYLALKDRIKCWEENTPGEEGVPDSDGNLSADTRQRLEDLGYLG